MFDKRNWIRRIATLFPSLFINFAYRQLTNPQVYKLRENELKTLAKAEKEQIEFKGFSIQLYHWNRGPNTILLVHGWEGQAGNFSDLVETLLAENYSILAFDGPSHGFSSRGKTSLFEFTDLVAVLIQQYQIRYLVSHSFGGVATTYALSTIPDWEIEKYVLLTTPDKFSERIDAVVEQVGLTEKVKQGLINRIEAEIEQDVASLNVSTFVQQIKVAQALIIHDVNDRVIPIEQSRRVQQNWSNSKLQEVEGTGHFKILRTATVLKTVKEFLQGT